MLKQRFFCELFQLWPRPCSNWQKWVSFLLLISLRGRLTIHARTADLQITQSTWAPPLSPLQRAESWAFKALKSLDSISRSCNPASSFLTICHFIWILPLVLPVMDVTALNPPCCAAAAATWYSISSMSHLGPSFKIHMKRLSHDTRRG